ncbi:hypothetical protein ACIBCH_22610 [Amycolatopsis thailandensis]|uniref:hypothetical protein n=1 Tax=Amycolatopsis thailandensis TaxID=589330 RepID=UPI00378EA189
MQAFRKLKPPIQSALPRPGLTPLELAHDLVERIRFDQYQALWDLVGNSWLKYRQADKAN